jgi:tRNA-dihydrouridine synthase
MTLERHSPRLILAPLKGFTDAIFRNTFAEHFNGFDAALAPFVAAAGADRLTEKHVRDLLPHQNTRIAIEPQILGNHPDDFIFLARRLHEIGYLRVNWNLGCPFRPVTKKCRGSGLLPFPERVDEFLDKVLPAIPNGLSIKMRLGRNTAEDILALLPILNRYPIEEITIHPRTARQMYTGRPDLDTFAVCLEGCRHQVVYNGDITDLTRFFALAVRFPTVAAWMIGRGALSDPFLPAAIKNGREEESTGKLEKFKAFYDDLFARYQERLNGPGHLLNHMKGFWTYFAGAFKNGSDIGKRIHRTATLPGYLNRVERFFAEEGVWRAE